jgi:hypothetical protein
MVLPTINDREAVPVRLIPFLVNWNPLSPDALAHLFAGTHLIHRDWGLVAYRVDALGVEWPIHRDTWWNTADSLDEQAIRLQRKGASHAEWERESLGILPTGAFVWRDEFEAEYRRKFGRYKAFRVPADVRLGEKVGDEHSFDELVADLSSAEDEDDFFSGAHEHMEAPHDQMDNLFSYSPTGRDDEVFKGFEKFMPAVAPTVVLPVESGLIEREFYPLDALAARWRCTSNDIVHLGGTGAAQVCANIYGLACGLDMQRITSPDDELDDDMPDGVFELTPETLRILEMPSAFPFELEDGFRYCRRSWWECEFSPPVPIQHGHLCVLRTEVVRLDAEVFSAVLGGRVETGGAAARTESTAARPRDDCEMKKGALIKKYADRWPSIGRDFKDAAAPDGLRSAAGGTRHGWWWEGAALEWARVRGKLNHPVQVPSSVFHMGRKKG